MAPDSTRLARHMEHGLDPYKNFIIAGCIYYACYQAYAVSVFGTLGAWLDEQEEGMTKTEREELAEDMLEPLFIPLPFTTKMVESPPYRYSDPEWKAFVSVSKDRDLMRAIQGGLAELVRKTAESSASLVKKCGADMKLGRYWLDIQYPARPPPTFVRLGICVDDTSISIAEQAVESMVVFRTRRALWPDILSLSLLSFSEELMKQNALYIAKLFGFEPTPSPPLQQTIERIQQRLKKPTSPFPSANTQAANGSSTHSSSSAEKGPAKPSPAPDLSSAAPGASVGGPDPISSGADPGRPKSVRDIHVIKYTQEHTSGAWQALRKKFAQTWFPLRDLPPRGSILVSGLVEITTSRCFLTIDAYAFWDPKTRKFDMKTGIFRIRSIRMRAQSAAP
ncbi:hypothetical protein AAE478_009821 [Parahypoxylon ruwenzoriense]